MTTEQRSTRWWGVAAGGFIVVGSMFLAFCAKADPSDRADFNPYGAATGYFAGEISGTRPADCPPGLWCACYLAKKLGLSGVHWNKNKASEWGRNLARASGPGVGVIVVWPHHVGQIVGQSARGWIVHSGNVRNRVHTGEMNLRGAVFRQL